ncbi:hypothetical protein VTP01DRAFT_1308 [Rhizomucor pusillus]|uniref:uncharacterized protein n=1 Tax=Rhizomucor pusillus TaxID=4840 RepID=UPI003744736F
MRRKDAVQRLAALSVGKSKAQASLSLSISNLIHRLPHETLIEETHYGESEPWSSTLDPVLSAIIADPDRNVYLRCHWRKQSVDTSRIQFDVTLCIIDQLTSGSSVDHGEAKFAEPTGNVDALASDLARLAPLNKRCHREDRAGFGTFVPNTWWHITVYMTTMLPDASILVHCND